jgi:hypothetical protein
VDAFPPIDFARIGPRDNPFANAGVLIAVLVLAAAAWLLWPLSWWRHLGRVGVAGETRATMVALLNSALIIGYFVVTGMSLVDQRKLVFGLPQEFLHALWIPIALIPLLLVQFAYGYRAWVRSFWWPARRIHYTLLILAGIAFVAWAFYWHLTAVILDV